MNAFIELLKSQSELAEKIKSIEKELEVIENDLKTKLELIDDDNDKTLAMMLIGELFYDIFEPWDRNLMDQVTNALKKYSILFTLTPIQTSDGTGYKCTVDWKSFYLTC
jgi:ABC-type phosphate transport system auxiliary subunit